MTSSDTTPGDKASARTDAAALRQRLADKAGVQAATRAADVTWSALGDRPPIRWPPATGRSAPSLTVGR